MMVSFELAVLLDEQQMAQRGMTFETRGAPPRQTRAHAKKVAGFWLLKPGTMPLAPYRAGTTTRDVTTTA